MAAVAPSCGSDAIAEIVGTAAESTHVALSLAQLASLVEFAELLSHWNRTFNLTAAADAAAIASSHIADCLTLVEPLRRELSKSAGRRILDVGSGGGLPGVVIACVAPELTVTCIDAVGKKSAFVVHAAAALRLGNVVALHQRVENFSCGPFDAVVSRAYATIGKFVGDTRHLLGASSVWGAMKGAVPKQELASLPEYVARFHVERLAMVAPQMERCLVWLWPSSTGNSEPWHSPQCPTLARSGAR